MASKKIPFMVKLYLNALIPYNLLKIGYNYVIKVKNINNPFKFTEGKKLVGKPVISITKLIDFGKVSQINKKMGIIFNSFMTCILITALKQQERV